MSRDMSFAFDLFGLATAQCFGFSPQKRNHLCAEKTSPFGLITLGVKVYPFIHVVWQEEQHFSRHTKHTTETLQVLHGLILKLQGDSSLHTPM